MKNKLMLFVYLLGSLISSIGYIQAQCNTCDIEITTGSGECDREIATKGDENSLILEPNKTFCITGDLEYSDISWADGATLRVTPGKTLTIQNNMANNTNNISLTIELYGTLIMGNPDFNPNLTLNIYSGGKFQTSGNATFRGNKVTINNEGNFDVKVLDFNGNNSNVLIQNGPKAEFLIGGNLNVGNSSTLFFQNEGKLEIQSQFGLSSTSVYSNCGNITTKGFNLQKGKVFNTGVMLIEENLDGEGLIENYGQITLSRIQGSGKTFINHGKVEVTSNNVVDMIIKGPEDPGIYGEFSWKGQVNGLNHLNVYGNQIFKNTEGESSKNEMLSNPSALEHDSQSSIVWGECEKCTVIFTGKGCFDPETGEQEPGPNPDPTNYWIGGTTDKMNDWAEPKNWTAERVPDEMEDIEFATEANNPTDASKPSSGPAKEDLHLDIDRNIGDLINKSDKNLIVTLENELVNTTNAVDDFAETDQNTPVSGNVLNNDYDLEGHTQTVSDPGTHQTEKGGSITIDADGSYTYTPPTSFSGLDQFEYEVCDDGESRACDKAFLLIGVNICAEKVVGESFTSGGEWVGDGKIRSFSFTQPGTNYGFVLDIYKLDNSFNMEINGTKIAVNEIEFQPQDPEVTTETLDTNVEFADGTQYTAKYYNPDNQPNIFLMEGDEENPLVRVIISPRGSVTLWGSKVSKGPLFPLVLTENIEGQNRFNNITWNTTETNNIIVTQHVVGNTVMIGYGYGQNIAFCGETVNYWMGGTPDEENAWNVPSNWTANFVPGPGQDVEFATVNNYGAPAVADLHLDDFPQDDTDGRIIGKLVNNSDKDLVITTGNQLTIDGEVVAKTVQNDGLFGEGTILVKSTNVTTNENEPTGTLLFNPDNNPNGVQAEVEFYNTAYDCADCGFYTRSWQYFGVPVQQSGITPPFTSDNEVNEWNEPTNGDKWITPNHPLTAFTGYQVTRNTTDEPDHTNAVHLFNGSLNITDASVALIRTDNVNYSGVNLIGNSYTAAIPISTDAIDIPTGVESTIYLFNTGTRDEWRKLNGSSTVGGVAGGQYLSVPINTAGEGNLPDRIPSMHTFMILVPEGSSGGNVGINYNQLVKNTTVNRGDGTRIVTRSAGTSTETGASSSIPTLVMDVIGEQSADRAWLFAKEGTTHGFDNGWDGRKMAESGIAQLYVAGTDESKLQVATMPTMDNVSLGFAAETDGKYTFEFSLSEHMNSAGLFLHDQVTGASVELSNGVSYTFEASKGETVSRFRLTQSGVFGAIGDEALISVEQNSDGKIVIKNNSGNAVTAFISNSSGATLQSVDIDPNSEAELDNIGVGLYVVRLQNAVLNDARRLIVK